MQKPKILGLKRENGRFILWSKQIEPDESLECDSSCVKIYSGGASAPQTQGLQKIGSTEKPIPIRFFGHSTDSDSDFDSISIQLHN